MRDMRPFGARAHRRAFRRVEGSSAKKKCRGEIAPKRLTGSRRKEIVKTGSLDNQAWLTWAARPRQSEIHALHPQGSQARAMGGKTNITCYHVIFLTLC